LLTEAAPIPERQRAASSREWVIFAHLEAAGVEYVVAMGNNAVLARHAEPSVAPLRAVVATTHDTATTYAEAAYQAGTWAAPRRAIIKAEVVWHHGREPRDNPRCVITNLRQTPEWIYTHVYCARSDSENRFKELTLALAFGRTSCTRFWANQLRITLTAAAFVLFQELQLRADRTALRGAQVPRLRQAVITIGVQVVRSVRRIILHVPRSHPDAVTWTRLARALGAVPAYTSTTPNGLHAGGVAAPAPSEASWPRGSASDAIQTLAAVDRCRKVVVTVVRLVVEDVVSPPGLPARDHLAANDYAALREADLFPKLRQLVPPRLAEGGRDELGADVAFAKLFLVHRARLPVLLLRRTVVYLLPGGAEDDPVTATQPDKARVWLVHCCRSYTTTTLTNLNMVFRICLSIVGLLRRP